MHHSGCHSFTKKVPGDLNDFDTVEFVVSNDGNRDRLDSVSFIKEAKIESKIISA